MAAIDRKASEEATAGDLGGTEFWAGVQAAGDVKITAAQVLAYIKTALSLGTAAQKNTGTGADNVPVLDANGKLATSIVPTLATVATTGSAADLTGTLPAARLPALSGDVTTTAGSTATSLKDGVVAFAKLASTLVGSAGEVLANTASKIVSVASLWSAQAFTTQTVTTGTLALDLSTFVNTQVTLSGNLTLGQHANLKDGQQGVVYLVQPASGGPFTLAANVTYNKFPGGTVPTLSTTAGAKDRMAYVVRGGVVEWSGLDKDIR